MGRYGGYWTEIAGAMTRFEHEQEQKLEQLPGQVDGEMGEMSGFDDLGGVLQMDDVGTRNNNKGAMGPYKRMMRKWIE